MKGFIAHWIALTIASLPGIPRLRSRNPREQDHQDFINMPNKKKRRNKKGKGR